MAKKRGGSLADVFLSLPWILRVLVAIFFDFVLGIIRLIDGLMQGNIVKILLGILWIFYGLGIGWILDIICVLLNRRPFFF